MAVVIVVAAGMVSYAATRPGATDIAGVRSYPNLPGNHVTGTVDYPQTPPAGGNHATVPLTCGIYDQPVPNENAVHSLEHGALWITYRPGLAAVQLATLKGLVRGNDHRAMSPYTGLPASIVATAWGKQLYVKNASDPLLAKFVSVYTQGPTTPESGAACQGVAPPPADRRLTTMTRSYRPLPLPLPLSLPLWRCHPRRQPSAAARYAPGRAGLWPRHQAGRRAAGMCLRSAVPRLIPLVVLPIRLVAACGSAPGRGVLRPQGLAATPSSLARVATPSLEPCRGAAAAARAQLPAVTLCCLGGGPAVPPGHLLARSYIANLWASWGMQCQRAAPRMAAAAVAAHGHVDFLGIDTRDDRASALDFRHHVGISYPQLADPRGDVGHHLGLPRIPVTLALDAGGRIVYRRIGEISAAQLAVAMHAADSALSTGAGAGG